LHHTSHTTIARKYMYIPSSAKAVNRVSILAKANFIAQVNCVGQLFGTRQIEGETLVVSGVSYFGQRLNNQPNN
jgi:hypothetical protein